MIVTAIKTAGRHVFRALVYGISGGLIVLLVVGVMALNNKPDLKIWHTSHLDEEFTAGSQVDSFDEYLELENRLFDQLQKQVYAQIEPVDRRAINRYYSGSLSDPQSAPTNWNRSFEQPAEQARIGVVLLHGMSDSPYSMRSIAEKLHDQGAWVLGLRIPGHGQAPSGLVSVDWQDMRAAVRLAVRHVRDKTGTKPLYIVGYSNGGALAVQYALDSLGDATLPALDGLVLLSPEIGISKLAAFAAFQERLGHLLGLQKLAWTDVLPEYDPWKYGSFALNAAKQAHLITAKIQDEITDLGEAGKLGRMPPILAFQSVVDATVTAPALVNNLFNRLPAGDVQAHASGAGSHELVLFDINRFARMEPMMNQNPSSWIQPMLADLHRTFTLTLLTNQDNQTKELAVVMLAPGAATGELCDMDVTWPPSVYSLSHVALPFPPDDPYYGANPADSNPVHHLGELAPRGERDVLLISAANMLRLRWNPFHEYMMQRIVAFVGLGENPYDSCYKSNAPSMNVPSTTPIGE